MRYIFILSSALLFCACYEPESPADKPETLETSNSVNIKVDSSNSETLINELTKIINEQPEGAFVSGLLMKQEKGTDNISRLIILSDSGSIITVPYNPPLNSEDVRKFTREGSEVSLKYTINEKGDTTVVFFSGNNK